MKIPTIRQDYGPRTILALLTVCLCPWLYAAEQPRTAEPAFRDSANQVARALSQRPEAKTPSCFPPVVMQSNTVVRSKTPELLPGDEIIQVDDNQLQTNSKEFLTVIRQLVPTQTLNLQVRPQTYFQLSAPIQPGNSGGPVVAVNGYVVGIIAATAKVQSFVTATATLPQNLNWAVKSEFAAALFHDSVTQPPVSNRDQAIALAQRAAGRVSVEF